MFIFLYGFIVAVKKIFCLCLPLVNMARTSDLQQICGNRGGYRDMRGSCTVEINYSSDRETYIFLC